MSTALTISRILHAIAGASGESEADIMSTRRQDELAIARHLFVWMVRHHMGYGVRETARQLDKPVSTVAYHCETARGLMHTDKRMVRLYSRALSVLGLPMGVQ